MTCLTDFDSPMGSPTIESLFRGKKRWRARGVCGVNQTYFIILVCIWDVTLHAYTSPLLKYVRWINIAYTCAHSIHLNDTPNSAWVDTPMRCMINSRDYLNLLIFIQWKEHRHYLKWLWLSCLPALLSLKHHVAQTSPVSLSRSSYSCSADITRFIIQIVLFIAFRGNHKCINESLNYWQFSRAYRWSSQWKDPCNHCHSGK